MYLAVLDFLNVWLGDNTIQLFGFAGNLFIKSSNSRTHLFLNKFDLAVHIYVCMCLCIFLYLYRLPYMIVRVHMYMCTIHLQFKNKINTTRSSASLFLLFLLLLRCQLSHSSLVAEFLPDNFIHTNNTSTRTYTRFN